MDAAVADAAVVVAAATVAAAENRMRNAAVGGTTIRPASLDDFPSIAALLLDAGLPIAGVEDHLAGFLVAEREGRILGCAGIEQHGGAALLRSVAVASGERGRGLGTRLVVACLGQAREAAVASVSLLTGTAESFFPRFGFMSIDRTELPRSLAGSEELRGACPENAHAMLLTIEK